MKNNNRNEIGKKNIAGSCCCGGEHSEKEVEGSCCCGAEHTEKEVERSCCCGGDHAEKEVEGSCCCGAEHNSKINSCCGGKHIDYQKDGFNKVALKLSVSLIFLVLGFFNWHGISNGSGILMALYYVNPSWVTVIICGMPIFMSAISTIKKKKLNSSVLISIAMIASIALEIFGFYFDFSAGGHKHSYVFAAGEIAFLMALGELIESLTVKKCRSGIERLAGLIPKEAFVKVGERLEKRSMSEIHIGDIVVVKSGEMVAVDGFVVGGEGSIDQSSVTGEYLPVDVSVGDTVYGGTLNKNGVIEVKVTKSQKDMTIAKMAELVEEASGKKAPISRLADKWAGYIVPIVLVTAVLVGIIAQFVFKVGAINSIIRAATVLVVFCPCALALATPTAIAAGLGNAAKNGVLIKSGASLEELSRVKTICFDKTGTLTEGKILLDSILAIGISEDELLKKVASIELYSEHPLATAIVSKAEGLEYYTAKNIITLQGVGLEGNVNGSIVGVYSYQKAIERGVDVSNIKSEVEIQLGKGNTVVVAVVDKKLCGMFSFSDTIRANAVDVISELNESGYKTVMLTGDNQKSAEYIGEICKISEVKHSLMPEAKLKAIADMQASGQKVCMLGDGINDAPSLKLADVSFAMGALGSDIAIDTADIAILNSDLNKFGDTLKLAKRSIFAIKRNIVIAMMVNVLAVIASTLGWLNPVSGALVHNCTSILVVLSSAMLLKSKGRKQAHY
ncbi:MAG: cation-translocating P-type ATPase [Clostridia bacterium]